MFKIGFDNDLYLKLQSGKIQERIAQFGGKLYLEFGGKLFDDYHASRVLPGFQPDSKLQMLTVLKDQAEIVIVINACDIEKNKMRGDLGITYDADVLRLIDAFRLAGFYVGSAVLTQYSAKPAATAFSARLEKLGVKTYHHYNIEGYPYDVQGIVSDEGYGKNEFIETSRSLVIVTAPGPGSGKMAVCLSQLYHENIRGVMAGYAKFETFPIWNLPLKHPVNIAYEAATLDLGDVNMIDPFHMDAYGKMAVNYNRDIEIYPVVNAMFEKIYGSSPYKSPTDMGVNMAGSCITDDKIVADAARDEIIRRYYACACAERKGLVEDHNQTDKCELLMRQAGVLLERRKVVAAALEKEKATGAPAAAIELDDGRIIIGKTTSLLGASSAMLLNALKALAGVDDSQYLISQTYIEPIQKLKVNILGNRNPRLHMDEVLLALCICASTDENAAKCVAQLKNLKNCEAHSTVILSQVDENIYRKLGINLTCEPVYQAKKLYHK